MSNQQLAAMNILPASKTVVFYSPVDGKDVFVRSGSMTEGNSIIHSLLHACYSDYIFKEPKDKLKLHNKFYKKIQQKIWEKQPVNKEIFLKEANHVFEQFYIDVKGGELYKNNLELYQTLCELVSFENFSTVILPSSLEKNDNVTMKTLTKNIISETKEFTANVLTNFGEELEQQRKKSFVKKLSKVVHTLLLKINNTLYTIFSNSQLTINQNTLEIISKKLNRDIYIFNSTNRLPVNILPETSIKNRKSILILSINGHYEVIGKLLSSNKVQREFNRKDSIIKRIKAFLYQPDIIEEHYPELLPYIQQQHSKSKSSRSSSESSVKSSVKSSARSSARSSDKSSDKSSARSSARSSSEMSARSSSMKKRSLRMSRRR